MEIPGEGIIWIAGDFLISDGDWRPFGAIRSPALGIRSCFAIGLAISQLAAWFLDFEAMPIEDFVVPGLLRYRLIENG